MLKIRNVIYTFWQCVWGFPQTLVGFVLYLANFKNKHFIYHGAIVTDWKYVGCVSLGLFVFVTNQQIAQWTYKNTLIHEYGHTIQSLILGPIYLFVIGLPSVLWLTMFKKFRQKTGISYYWFYPESWANYLGKMFT